MTEPVLVVKDLVKHFPGVLALDHASLEVRAHEVLGIVGENGAGKSTLLKILAGVYRPDGGQLLLRGEPVSFKNVNEAMNAGVGMVFQEGGLVPNISVAENMFLGSEGSAVRAGMYRWGELYDRAQRQLERVGSTIAPNAITESLSLSERQMVELAKVLAIEDRANAEPIVLLDEPTAVLESKEIRALFGQINRLRGAASVIFVSHRLEETVELSDRIYVMRNASVVAECDPKKTTTDQLRDLMVGRALTGSYYRETDQLPYVDDSVRLQVEGATIRGKFEDVSFQVHRGEVLGIAGVRGSGRDAVARSLFGALRLDRGEILLDGSAITANGPSDAVALGIAYIPAERRSEGLVMGMGVDENMTLAHLREVMSGPFLNTHREGRVVRDWIDRLSIKTPGIHAPVRNLSGGNQQKVALAKWLLGGPRVLILDHPTRGLDVGAKSEVYALVRRLSAQGIGMLLISDTLEETIGLSHNVIAMKDGRISARVSAPAGNKPAPVAIVRHMV